MSPSACCAAGCSSPGRRLAALSRTRTAKELARLRKETTALREVNDILKKAAVSFARTAPQEWRIGACTSIGTSMPLRNWPDLLGCPGAPATGGRNPRCPSGGSRGTLSFQEVVLPAAAAVGQPAGAGGTAPGQLTTRGPLAAGTGLVRPAAGSSCRWCLTCMTGRSFAGPQDPPHHDPRPPQGPTVYTQVLHRIKENR